MTETEHWVNEKCAEILAGGTVRLYRDLYKDLREKLPCGQACRIIAEGLRRTRGSGSADDPPVPLSVVVSRDRAVTALNRLEWWSAGPAAARGCGCGD